MKQKLFTLFAAVIIAANAMAQTTHKGHEYVDLGLTSGTLWATCNVGATAPEQAGDYFAWGETTTKSDYSWSTYKYCNGSSSTQTKYCTKSSYGTVDNKTTLEASDDAATANWGGAWRMPTYAEQTELRTECTWKWEKLNGVNGYRVTSKKDTSKSIFLPAAGVLRGTSLEDAGSHGRYWSSSLYESTPCYAYVLYFYSSRYQYEYYYRYLGQSVRPVCSSVQEYTITVSASEGGTATGDGEQFAGCTMTLTATPNEYYEFEKWSDGNTENPRTITVTQDSVFEAIFVENPKYTITLHAENGTISGAESGKQYYEGTALTLTATPNQGYAFAQWSDGNTDNPRTITVTQDSTLTATFALTQHTITLVAENGTISGATSGTKYDYGTELTLTATGNTGYTFSQWSDGVTTAERTIILTQDTTFTAEFAPIMFTITATANNEAYGSVTGGDEYQEGETATLIATPNEGYEFVKWTDANGNESEDATLTFVVTEDATYTAIFQAKSPETGVVESVLRDAECEVRKVIENGQVIIIRDGVRYNILGAQMK